MHPNEWNFGKFKPGHLCNSSEAWACLYYELARELPSIRSVVWQLRLARAKLEETRAASEEREKLGFLGLEEHYAALRAINRALLTLQSRFKVRRAAAAAFSDTDGFPDVPWLDLHGDVIRGIEKGAVVVKWGEHNPHALQMAEAGSPLVGFPLLVIVNPSLGRKEIEQAVLEGLRTMFEVLGIEKKTRSGNAFLVLRDLGLSRLRKHFGPKEAERIADKADLSPCDSADWFRRRRRVADAAKRIFALPAEEQPDCCYW